MPDWQELVRQRLSSLELEPEERHEVIEELSGHLQDGFEECREQGLSEEAATRRVLSQVADWQNLRRRIQKARTKENIMTNRITQFWLPGILTFVLAEGLLGLLQKFGPKPWIPAWSGHPPVALFYAPWLLALPFIGAVGAYLSHRAGGSQRAMIFSTLFPVLAMLSLFLIAFPVVLIINHDVNHIPAAAFVLILLGWVLIPGAALLAGGLPTQLFLSRRLASGSMLSH
jgi:hypothetical protein